MRMVCPHGFRLCASLFLLASTTFAADPQLVINELMYNPVEFWPTSQPYPNTNLSEYVELYNAGTTTVSLANYRLDNGITFNFTNGTLAAGAYGLLCQNYAFFTNAYRNVNVTNILGQFSGNLNNGGERITLARFTGSNWVTEDTIEYLDDTDSDGTGKSLELINPKFARLNDQFAWDWGASTSVSGTPGVVNSRFLASPLPVAGDVTQDFALPPAGSALKISTRATGRDGDNAVSLQLEYRRDAVVTNTYTSATMHDDGIEGDLLANDGIFTAYMPTNGSALVTTDGDILEFRIKVTDLIGTRTFPATNRADAPSTWSYLAKFGADPHSGLAYPGEYETFHMLMTKANRTAFESRSVCVETPVDITLVTSEGDVIYNSGVRLRGSSSRVPTLGNYRIGLPTGASFDGRGEINLNQERALAQYIGMAVHANAGGVASDVHLSRVWLNESLKNPGQGIYCRLEGIDNDYLNSHLPGQAGGNVYMATGSDSCRPTYDGDLSYLGASIASYFSEYETKLENPFTAWYDLQALTLDLSQPVTSYPTILSNRVNISNFGRSFAASVCLDNAEGGYFCVSPNYADEMRLYCNPVTGQSEFFPWDYSDVVGMTGATVYNIWGFSMSVITKFLYNQPIIPYYTGNLLDISTNTMSDANMNLMFDEMGTKMNGLRSSTLSHIQLRRSNILANLNANLTVTGLAAGAPTLLLASTNSGATLNVSNFNQNVGAGQWSLLGSLAFPTAAATVKLTRQVGSPAFFTIADALMYSNAAMGSVIQENSGSGFSTAGTWSTAGSGGFADGPFHYSTTISSSATWTNILPQVGTYDIYAWVFTSTNGTSEGGTRYEVTAGQPAVLINVGGTAPQGYTAQVLVNGTPTSWNLFNNIWSMTNPITLPGDAANVTVQAVNPQGDVIKQLNFTAVGQRTPAIVPSSITTNVTLSAASGIHVVSNDVTIAAGGALTVTPNTTLLFVSGKKITVNGTLEILGTATSPVNGLPYAGATAWSIEASGPSASVVISNANFSSGRIVVTNGARLAIYNSQISGSQDTNGIIRAISAGSVYMSSSIISNFNRTRFDTSPTLIDQCLLTQMSAVGIEFTGAATTSTVRRTTLRNPTGTDGIVFSGTTVGLVTNVLVQDMSGAGILVTASTARVVNSLLVANTTGLRVSGTSAAVMLNCTVDEGTNSLNGTAFVTNTIFWDALVSVTNGPATVTACDIKLPANATYPGAGNLNRKAFFRNSAERDYQLLPISPCIGTGVGGAIMGVTYPTGANPIAPTNLALIATSNTIFLAWTDTSPDETGFEIYRSNGGTTFTRIATTAANVTNYTDTGLGQDNSYYYRLRAVHARGESTYTDVASARTTFQDMTQLLIQFLRITEIMYNPTGSDDAEFLEFKNISTNAILNLTGLYMDGARFAFTNGTTLGPQQFFVLARNATVFATAHPGVTINGVYAPPASGLSNSDESLSVTDATGTDIFKFDYADGSSGSSWYPTTDDGGYSLVPTDPNPYTGDPDDDLFWRASSATNGSAGVDDPEPAASGIVISEVLAHTDDPLEDAIEVHNIGTNSVNVSGWYLSDTLTNLKLYQVPTIAPIPPGGFRVVYAVNFSNAFLISEFGNESLYLSAAVNSNLTGYRSTFTFNGAIENGVSHGRHVRSDGGVDFTAISSRSFGMDNPATVTQFRTGTGLTNPAPKVGPVVINEIMYNPGPSGRQYVELINVTAGIAKLFNTNFAPTNAWNTWRFGSAFDFTFPTNTTLNPGEHILLSATPPAEFRDALGIDPAVRIFGPFSGNLANSGETLKLYKPEAPETNGFVPQVIVDLVQYRDAYPWPSAADNDGASLEKISSTTYGNDPTNWIAASVGGTPGKTNNATGAATVGFERITDSSLETNEVLQVNVLLQPALSSTVTVYYAVTGGSAVNGTDYTLSAGSVIFWPNETQKSIPLSILKNAAGEPDEQIEVTFTNITGNALLGGNIVYTHTIVDNDATNLPPPFILPSTTTDFTNSVLVTIVPPSIPSAFVYYTLDGTVPDRNDEFYTGPFTLHHSALIMARTFQGENNSGAWTSTLFRAQAIPLGWVPPSPLPSNTVEIVVRASSDDGWQNNGPGSTFLTSTTISLATNSNFGALFRFYDVGIPQGVVITNAWIQFTAASNTSVSSFVTIRGEATNDSPTLVAANNNIRNRLVTTNRVFWSPPAWNTSERGAAQRSPNLAAIITEIVGRPGWNATNALSLILTNTPSGVRVAYAFDGLPSQGALLHAEWAVDSPPVQFYLSALTNGAGSIAGGNLFVDIGSNATVTASAALNHYFAGWTGDTGGGDTNNPALTLLMDQPRTVTANFTPVQYLFTVLTNGNGTVSGGNLLFPAGTNASATAVPDDCHLFAGWSGDTDAANTNLTSLTVLMNQHRTVTASFAHVPPAPPRLVFLSFFLPGQPTMRWESDPCHSYSVFRSTNLLFSLRGEMVVTNMPGDSSGTNSYTDASVTNPAAFYSISAENP